MLVVLVGFLANDLQLSLQFFTLHLRVLKGIFLESKKNCGYEFDYVDSEVFYAFTLKIELLKSLLQLFFCVFAPLFPNIYFLAGPGLRFLEVKIFYY